MVYLKGAANKVADALSRGAVPLKDLSIVKSIPNELVVGAVLEESKWAAELRKHSVYGEVTMGLEEGRLDNDVAFPDVARKYKVADFTMDQGVLVLMGNEHRRMVVPPSEHFGSRKLIRQLSKRLFWESLSRDVAKWSEECRECLCHDAQSTMTAPLKPIRTSKPYEIVGIDILEIWLTSSSNRYILSVVDHFSKFGGAYAIPNKAADK
uniref:RNA-directed DNA polymerase n=1 Tax=Haemonchus contortus TaxID=6289 RepID=A0A7I4XWA6_HAECO